MLGNRSFFRCLAAVVPAAMLVLNGCVRTGQPHVEFESVMGTVCSVTLYDQAERQVYRDVFGRIREIENCMSANISETDIGRINAAAGIAPVQIPLDVFMVIERAVYYAEISAGAFDPTVGPLVSLWGIGGDNPRIPSQAEIDAVLPLVNWRDIELDREQRSVFLKRPGMALDLGAIAKGYAADEALELIKKAGIKGAIADLGGDVLLYGEKQDKSPWRVGLQNPDEKRGASVGFIHGRGQMAVVTSGVYERYFTADEIRYHHIFSPFDGYPARNGLLSVTIVTGNAMDADALATAVFVMGYEKGRALVESFEGAGAVFIFEDKTIRKTAGVDFTITDDDFSLWDSGYGTAP